MNRLHCRVSQNGSPERYPVVFLHGFLESSTMWKPLEVEEDLNCIFIDLPGHGKSAWEDGEFAMKDVATKVIELLNELEVEHYHLVGHSMGGYVGLEVKRADSRCKKLVLLNSNFWQDSSEKQRDRHRVAQLVETKKEHFIREAIPNLFMEPSNQPNFVRSLVEGALSIDWQVVAESSIAMSQRNHNREVVVENGDDILIVQGKYDTVVPESLMNENCEGLELSYLLLESGHMSHIESTDQVREGLITFLS